jgi:predicted nuclease of restriction endonuclease-like RecB superfamily
MKKSMLIAMIIRVYGVYPPEKTSKKDLLSLRKMLFQHGKPKRSFSDQQDVAKLLDPSFPIIEEPFYVEEEPNESVEALTNFMPLSDEDGSESPTIGSKKVLSWPYDSPLKRTRF